MNRGNGLFSVEKNYSFSYPNGSQNASRETGEQMSKYGGFNFRHCYRKSKITGF